jgi:hypothetical protein
MRCTSALRKFRLQTLDGGISVHLLFTTSKNTSNYLVVYDLQPTPENCPVVRLYVRLNGCGAGLTYRLTSYPGYAGFCSATRSAITCFSAKTPRQCYSLLSAACHKNSAFLVVVDACRYV